MNLTRISDKETIEIMKFCEHPVFKAGQEPDGEIAFMAIDERRVYRKIAQAQLEADKKDYDNLQIEKQMLEEELVGRKKAHKEKVREIFEELENDCWIDIYPKGTLGYAKWQALKQKYLEE